MHINTLQSIVEKNGIIFLTYGGFLTQSLIVGMTEALEKEAKYDNLNMGIANSIFTIFIELAQNVMNYSKSKDINTQARRSEGFIVVSKDKMNNYSIHCQNIITKNDMLKINLKLKEISKLNKNELKKKYRELRSSGKNTHEKGGGIGFYEIAKRSNNIKFEFEEITKDRYYFHFVSYVKIKKELNE